MGKSRVQTRVDPDTEASITEYAEEREIGNSEAVRRLIRTGLAAEGYPVATADGGPQTPLERLASRWTVGLGGLILMVGGFLLIPAATLAAGGSPAPAFALMGLGGILMGAGVSLILTAAVAQVALAEPLRGLILEGNTDP
jgi:hypothetical protein